MQKRAPLSAKNAEDTLTYERLDYVARGWLLDCEIQQMSNRTLSSRRDVTEKLAWFLRLKRLDQCGPLEVRAFLLYLTRSHEEPGGRWGNPRETKPLKPATIVSYFNILRTLFNHAVESGDLEVSPMARLKPPLDRADDVQPFTPEQVVLLLSAAKVSVSPKRNTAILYLLLDTGIRASELAGLRAQDLDLGTRTLRVEGKGGKARSVPFGRKATKALWGYLRETQREGAEPLFFGERGHTPGMPLTRSGVGDLVRDLGAAAGLREAVRCSPHTFRHTFAIEFLRNGGNQFTLMRLLGHTDLAQTSKYLKLAQADVEKQHRQFSPADRMRT